MSISSIAIATSIICNHTVGERVCYNRRPQRAAMTTQFGAGAQLGPYEIQAKLGGGGMGEVYRAYDTRLHREVAIKVLPRDKMADPKRKRRFLQEARAASALNHPRISSMLPTEN